MIDFVPKRARRPQFRSNVGMFTDDLRPILSTVTNFSTLRPRPIGRPFLDDIFKGIFLNENVWITIKHYNDVIMSTMASQVTSLTIVYSSVYSGANQRKHQSSVSLAFGKGIHQWPVNFPHKGPVTRKMFPFDDVIMISLKFVSLFLRVQLTNNIQAMVQIMASRRLGDKSLPDG